MNPGVTYAQIRATCCILKKVSELRRQPFRLLPQRKYSSPVTMVLLLVADRRRGCGNLPAVTSCVYGDVTGRLYGERGGLLNMR